MPLLSDENRRKRNLIILAGFLVLVGTANFLDIGVYAPDLPLASNIAVFALLNLNLIVLLLLVLLLFRNLVKLWFERRENVIGAKFKSKLVLAFLTLSLIPSTLIFLIASNFITKSIEGWFKPQVERPLDQALAVAQTYYSNLERTALRHAQHIGRVIDRDGLLADTRRETLAAYLVEQQDRLGISAITVFGPHGQELVHVKDPILGDLATRDVNENQLRQGASGQELTTVREIASGDLVEAVVPVWAARGAERRVVGVVVVGTHVTDRLDARLRDQAAQAAEDADQGHLHPALPAHDADRRVLVHVDRPLPRARDHGSHRAARRGHARGRRRQPRLQGADAGRRRDRRPRRVLQPYDGRPGEIEAAARRGVPRPVGQAH